MPAPNSSAEPAARGAVTVRGLAPALKARLRVRAAMNARSMEAEARAILEAALAVLEENMTDLASFARSLFTPIGGVELELPTRESAREPLEFASSPEERPAVSKPRQKADGGTRRR